MRRYLRRRGITARIARIGRDSSARLGRHRWVVERTLGWLLSYKLQLACALICYRQLPESLRNDF